MAFHTLAKVQLERLRLFLEDRQEAGTGLLLGDRITAVETVIQEGLQKFPDEPYLLDIESRLGEILADDDRAVAALQTAFSKMPDSALLRFAWPSLLQSRGMTSER